jgi:hypothetical protein
MDKKGQKTPLHNLQSLPKLILYTQKPFSGIFF